MHSAIPVFDATYRRMNQQPRIDIRHSTCPHDCPSACALDVEVIDGSAIGRVRGSRLQSYTAGVVSAKVARYAERIHHPDRLMHPLRRTGAKGSGQFARISWDEALDEIAARFNAAEREFGAQSVWPYYYAGTMGLVMRDGINRLAHVKKYSRFYSTICADVAFACGVMHVLFREGYADQPYMDRYTDCPRELEAHLATRTPEWASSICGVPVEEIEAFARQIGQTKRSFFRLGYGFTRSRSGAAQMHAALCIPAVTGAWQYEGGGAFFNNYAIWRFNESLIEGHDAIDRTTRLLDQSQIGRILTGDAEALRGGPPVKAMLIQNTNPMAVAPEQALVRQGFAREDLFMAVHEQFMAETAQMADIVLPATMFMEHDDLYYGGGHQHISVGAKLIEPPGECRSNHEVLQGLGRRLNAVHPGFEMSPRELIDATLKKSGHGDIETLEADLWRDLQPDFRASHYLDGFAHADRKFHFKADWAHPPFGIAGMGPWQQMPSLPDHWTIIEEADEAHPFRLATSPSRSFLNSSFNETPSSQAREGAPSVMMHPADAATLGVADGDAVTLGNMRGETTLTAKIFDGLRRGVLIAESIHPNNAHIGGRGINMLTGAEAVAPVESIPRSARRDAGHR